MIRVILGIQALLVGSKLVITQPESLAKSFIDQKVPYSMANFGHFPYGKSLTGRLKLPSNGANHSFDFCEPMPVIMDRQQPTDALGDWFIARRGNCTFTRKAKNAQMAGAGMIIIVDNRYERSESITMSDDGNGYMINIPAIFINLEQGERIIKAVEEMDSTNTTQDVLALAIFDDTQKQSTPYVLLGLTIENRQTFKFLYDMKPYYEGLKDQVKFDIYYDLAPCWVCHYNGFDKEEPNCLGGGRYCSIDPDGTGVGTGQNVVYETLRQYCLFTLNPDFWWDYMIKFDEECLKAQEYADCSHRIIKNATLNQQVGHCVASSFDQASDNQKMALNSILDRWIQYRGTTGIVFYPGATVNNQTYRGSFNAEDVVQDICSGYQGMIKRASTCDEQAPIQSGGSSYIGLVLLVCVTCVLFSLFMVFIYRRILRRQLSVEMGQQVNQMVSQYISFYEGNQGSTRTS